MKKHKKLIIAAVVILLAAAWVWRYVTMNKYYDDLDNGGYKLYQLGEMVPFEDDGLDSSTDLNGCYVRADSFVIKNCDDYLNETGFTLPDTYIKPEKLALVNITLKNESSEEKPLTLTKIGLHSVDSTVKMNWDLLIAANPRLNGHSVISIAAGEVCSILLPYDLEKARFGSRTWRNIEDSKFYLKVTDVLIVKDILVNE